MPPLVRKNTIQFSVGSYLNVFNSLIWMLTFISILLISGINSECIKTKSTEEKFLEYKFQLDLGLSKHVDDQTSIVFIDETYHSSLFDVLDSDFEYNFI